MTDGKKGRKIVVIAVAVIFFLCVLISAAYVMLKVHSAYGMLGGKGDQSGLTKDQKSSRRHFARLTEDGFLTIFDNGTNMVMSSYPKQYEGSGKGITRILKLKLDQINKKLISCQALTLDQQYSAYMGSATEIILDSDTFLVGWGGRTTQNALFSLIDFANHKVLFEAVAPVDANIYRAYWFAE